MADSRPNCLILGHQPNSCRRYLQRECVRCGYRKRSVSPWHCLASTRGIRMISGNLALECGQTFCLTVRSERCRKSGEARAASSGGGKAGLWKEIKEKMTLRLFFVFFTPTTTTTTTLNIKHWKNINALQTAAMLIV